MKKFILPLVLIVFSLESWSQVYTEDFDGVDTWTLNTVVGADASFANQWYISCQEEGKTAGECGEPCSTGNNTLHVSTGPGVAGDLGAAYFEVGSGGWADTDKRAESGDISTSGWTSMTLSFDFIGWGTPADFTELVYSIDGGTSWTVLDPALTSLCCGGISCSGTDQGLWENASYVLPPECEGLSDFRIGFVWHNVDDGTATDPSFAVDNILIDGSSGCSTPPTAAFTPGDMTICAEDGLTFSDESTTCDAITSYIWDFPGGSPSSATGPGPHSITWSTGGSYDVTLTVVDGVGTDDSVITVIVEDEPNVGPNNSTIVCATGGTIDVNTMLVGADLGGTWTETTSSGSFDSGTGVFDYTGLAPGDYLFEYTITPVACSPATSVMTVTVQDVDFAGSDSTVTFCDYDGTLDLFTVLGGAYDLGGSWSDDDGAGGLTGSSLDLAIPPAPGTYNYTYTVDNADPCADDQATVTVTIQHCLGIGEEGSVELVVYPNPVTREINLSEYGLEIQQMQLYSTSGQLIQTANTTYMDVSLLAAGTYILRVESQGQLFHTQIIKE